MTWWHYLLLSNLYLILFFGFYALLLQRETFFQLNRVYLLGSAIISFLIPAIQSDWVKQWLITQKVHQTLYSASPNLVYGIQAIQPDRITIGEIVGGIYATGIVVLSVKLLWQFVVLRQLLKNKKVAAAWSFFKNIEVDEQLESRDVIMAHEEVHARQWHSADVMLMEMLMIINWFNPVVYLYRRSVKNIHEFIADQNAVQAGTSKAEYAMLLVSQTFNAPVHHLLNPFFNSSILKQRIVMLQKSKSHYSALLKYGFSAPLFALMLALSSATINNSDVVETLHNQAETMFDVAAPVPFETTTGLSTNTSRKNLAKKAGVLALKRNAAAKIHSQNVEINNADLTPVTNTNVAVHNEVFTSVEKLPSFQGGMESFGKYLNKTLRYPKEAQDQGRQGRVIVTFIVEADGSLTDVHTIRDPGLGLGEEAVRVINASPKWIPGEQNSRKVRVQYTVPVVFTLSEDGEPEPKKEEMKSAKIKSVSFIRHINLNGTSVTDSTSSKQPLKMLVLSRKKTDTNAPQPMIVIDGKEAPEGLLLNNVKADQINRIDVYKDENATRLYGDKGKNGVVAISTKNKP
ncbi:TonB family protein [Mucilaginibacter sp. CSA2-8R]|uniref:TonB family protein n=1 Tax=Mucilaginibacter sp. CSA2-8R TaxID=3141542 RepID=UPI00315D9E2A